MGIYDCLYLIGLHNKMGEFRVQVHFMRDYYEIIIF